MKAITVWQRSEFRGRGEWEHNHIEDGHVPDTQTGPTPHTAEQANSWNNSCWRKRHAYLVNGVVTYP